MKAVRQLTWLGSVILAATAALHATGYAAVTRTVAASSIEGFLKNAIGGLWLFASVHWLFLALLAVVAVTAASRTTPYVLGLVACLLAVDVALLLLHVGPFMGAALVGAAALSYGFAALLGRYTAKTVETLRSPRGQA